jgi:hypothetical protein
MENTCEVRREEIVAAGYAEGAAGSLHIEEVITEDPFEEYCTYRDGRAQIPIEDSSSR